MKNRFLSWEEVERALQEVGNLPGTTESSGVVVNSWIWLKQLISNGKQLWEDGKGRLETEGWSLKGCFHGLCHQHCRSAGERRHWSGLCENVSFLMLLFLVFVFLSPYVWWDLQPMRKFICNCFFYKKSIKTTWRLISTKIFLISLKHRFLFLQHRLSKNWSLILFLLPFCV